MKKLRRPELDPKHHFIGSPDETATFIVAIDTINFGSGWWPVFKKRPGMSGYFTVATSLTEHFRANGAMTAPQLATITMNDCIRIFGQDRSNTPIVELMQHFANALNELGRFLIERFDGSVMRLIESADHSAERLAQTLGQLDYFDDVARYGELEVPLFKRAQLTAADVSIALRDHPLGRFHDLDRLTIFADNLVPHVLRIDGILRYDPQLAERIDREALIDPASTEEIELRACAVHASELIVQSLRASGKTVNAMGVDYLLWNRGQEPHYKQAKPRHRARSIFY
jgi:hypothetical protein